jgi:hypothetical protein
MKTPFAIERTFTTVAYCAQKTKSGIMWCGHVFKTDYAIPGIEKLIACTTRLFNLIKNFLLSGPKGLFSAAAALLLVSAVAFKMADRKDYEDDMVAKTAWKTAGIVAFMGSVALTSFGLINLSPF